LKTFLLFLLTVIFSTFLYAQEISWEREQDTGEGPLNLFHSIQAVNLPTAEMLAKNEFHYEISHRFIPTVDAENAYFGIDGPTVIRMALAYAVTDHMMLTFGRSNMDPVPS